MNPLVTLFAAALLMLPLAWTAEAAGARPVVRTLLERIRPADPFADRGGALATGSHAPLGSNVAA